MKHGETLSYVLTAVLGGALAGHLAGLIGVLGVFAGLAGVAFVDICMHLARQPHNAKDPHRAGLPVSGTP